MALPAGFAPIDFQQFHRRRLPELLAAGRAQLAGRAAAHLGSIAVHATGAGVFTYRPRAGALDVIEGDADADTVIEMDLDSWQGVVHELEAPAGLLYGGRIRCRRGNAVDFMAWETALRALYHGREPYDSGRIRLLDRAGRPLDLERTFALQDEREEMAHFLRVAGYLFVRNAFAADEIAAFRAEADALRREARQGDKLSWWGKNAAGEEVLCRVTRGSAKPHLATLRNDPRLLALKDLGDEELVYRKGEGEGVTVIFKHPGMVEGLGDLPWHRDCGMGGHAVMCPTAIASVYLTEASPETGELAFLPGSRDMAFNGHDPQCREHLLSAHFHARPGDVTLHYSDTVHAAPPPTAADRAAYRISAIVSYARPDARHHRGEASYNDVLHRRDDGQVEHLVSVAKRL
jgi:ectoine hydroxylase-related dioxygenase (phytanoyl-CoA dioxygenase family)